MCRPPVRALASTSYDSFPEQQSLKWRPPESGRRNRGRQVDEADVRQYFEPFAPRDSGIINRTRIPGPVKSQPVRRGSAPIQQSHSRSSTKRFIGATHRSRRWEFNWTAHFNSRSTKPDRDAKSNPSGSTRIHIGKRKRPQHASSLVRFPNARPFEQHGIPRKSLPPADRANGTSPKTSALTGHR